MTVPEATAATTWKTEFKVTEHEIRHSPYRTTTVLAVIFLTGTSNTSNTAVVHTATGSTVIQAQSQQQQQKKS